MLELKNVSAGYDAKTVIEGCSLTLPPASVTTLLGPNGSGKSTLLKAVTGSARLISGELILGGASLSSFTPLERAQRIAYLAQSHSVPDITAGRLVLHGRFPYLSFPRKYKSSDYDIARRAMAQLGISELWDCHMQTLSGGMRQKVYLAMALAQQSDIILMDEPTTFLDVGQQIKFSAAARALADSGKTLLLVLHDIPLALTVSDAVCVLLDGRVRFTGTPEELIASRILEDIYDIRIGVCDDENGRHYFCAAK